MTARVRFVAPADLTGADWEAWRGLVDHADGTAIFAEPWFMRAALEAVPHAQRMTLAIIAQRGRWLGVVPLAGALKVGRVPLPHWQVWRDTNQFVGLPLIAAGSEARVWRLLLGALDSLHDGRYALTLSMLPADAPATRALADVCAQTGRLHHVLTAGTRPAIMAVEGARYCLAASMPKKRRSRLRSQWRALSTEHAVTIRTLSQGEPVGDWIDAFLRLEAGGWKGRAQSALASCVQNTALFAAAATAAQAAGRLGFVMLSADGAPVAMSSYLVAGSRAFGFKCAYDEAFARFAPGLQLLDPVAESVNHIRPLTFDSCTVAGPSVLDEFWHGRVAIADVAVSLGRGMGLRAAIGATGRWHDLKLRAAPRLPG